MKFPKTTASQEQLENGLNVLTHEDHEHPLISFQIWVETGSMHEMPKPGAGLSHLLEHMVFKGTKNFSGEELMNRVEELGGSWNAYTTYDRTVYYIEGPSAASKEFLQLLFELVYEPTLPEADFEMEREVIRREIAMGNDDPHSVGWQELMKVYYQEDPRRFPIIGHLERFDAISHEEMVAYHAGRYTFDNSFIVLSGDIDGVAMKEQILEMAQQVEPRRLVEVGLPTERSLVVPVEASHEFAVPVSKSTVAWSIPQMGHPDVVALELLAVVIGGARSSLLFQELREKRELALSLSAWCWNPKAGDGFFAVSTESLPEKSESLFDALMELIDQLDLGEMESALKRAQKQSLMSQLGTLTTVSERASDVASNWFETRNVDFTRLYLEQIQEVTVADLVRVAQVYLKGQPYVMSSQMPVGYRAAQEKEKKEGASGIKPVMRTLANGMSLITGRDNKLPTVSFQVIYKGGIRMETEALEGIGTLYSSLLGKGTQQRSAEEYALAIDSLGASLSFTGGNNTFMISGYCLVDDVEELCDLALEALTQPLFDPSEMEKERRMLIAKIQESSQDPVRMAFWHSRRALFAESSYRFSRLGSEETVQRITAKDLQDHHEKLIENGEAVCTFFGDLDEALEETVAQRFAQLQNVPREEHVGEISYGAGRQDIVLEKEQAVIVVAYPGATVSCEDAPVLEVLQDYFTGMAGPLFVQLREERGLAYFVSCNQFLGIETGMFAFYMGTDPARKEEALSEMQRVISEVVEKGMTEEELKAVKTCLAAQNARQDQTHPNQARAHGLNVLMGKGVSHREIVRQKIQAMTTDEVQKCLKKYFSACDPVVTVVAPS